MACSSTPEATEVTRIVNEQIEVTRIVENDVEVTRIIKVEATREVEVTRGVEVTRIVEVIPTSTPGNTVTSNSLGDIDTSMAFSANYLGELEQDGITVELGRVLFMNRNAFPDDINFDDNTDFDGQEYFGEIIWRITNDTENQIEWAYDDILSV